MNHWAFILGAYALTFAGTVGLVAASYLVMRKAEAAVAALKDDR